MGPVGFTGINGVENGAGRSGLLQLDTVDQTRV